VHSQTPASIDEALAVVREILGMDVAYLSSIDGDAQTIVSVAGHGSRSGRAGSCR
jgi:hypothetical protein